MENRSPEPSGRRPSSPSLVLMNSRHSQEGQVRPLGSLMRSELPFMTVILVLIKVQNQLRADVQPENTALPRWLIQHLAVRWLFTTHSMPHSCKKPQSKTQELSVLHLSTGRERRDVCRDELQPPDSCSTRCCTRCITVYLIWKHPADWEFVLGASSFHTAFYQELIVSGEKSTIMIHLLQNKVIFNLNVAHLYKYISSRLLNCIIFALLWTFVVKLKNERNLH